MKAPLLLYSSLALGVALLLVACWPMVYCAARRVLAELHLFAAEIGGR